MDIVSEMRETEKNPVNLVKNPGFEDGWTSWNINGDWRFWVNDNPASSHGGNSHMEFGWTGAFITTISQKIEGLPDGIYKLSAWGMREAHGSFTDDGSLTYARLEVKDYGNDNRDLYYYLPGYESVGWGYHHIFIDNISVTGGSLTIAFTVSDQSENWHFCLLDDVELILKTPKKNPEPVNTVISNKSKSIAAKKNNPVQDYFICRVKSHDFTSPFSYFHDTLEIYEINFIPKNNTVAVFNDIDTDIKRAVVFQSDIEHDGFIIRFNPKTIQDICLSYPELTEQFVNKNANFQNCVLLDEPQKEKMFDLSNKILECYENKNAISYELKIKLVLCEILLFINEIYHASKTSQSVKNYNYNQQLHDIMEYIKDNLSGDISLDILAAKFFTGKQTLIKIFKTETGLTPNQYIIYHRMMKAREFLKQEHYVYKVCELVGYSNISSFIRAFKKITGYTPRDYLKKFNGSNLM